MRRFCFCAILLATVIYAVTSAGSATANTIPIVVGGVVGTHGDEGNQSEGATGGWSYIQRDYGFHCSGQECDADQTPPACVNTLMFSIARQSGDTETILVKAKTEMSNKMAEQKTHDWDCPLGPPAWVASGSIKLSDPMPGTADPAYDDDGGGHIADSWGHVSFPTTAWTKDSDDDPMPTGASGTTYADQSSQKQWSWNYDPNNTSTNNFVVNATVKTSFAGDAVEINVEKCWLKATCRLSIKLE